MKLLGRSRVEAIVVYITAPSEEEAEKIARTLVEERLAGCVNIIGGVRSLYRWEGRIEDDAEVLMIAKTRQQHFEALSRRVKELHSYTVPEVIAVPVVAGLQAYLEWLTDETV